MSGVSTDFIIHKDKDFSNSRNDELFLVGECS